MHCIVLHYNAKKVIEQKTVKMRKQNNRTEGKQKLFKLYSYYQQD